MSKGNFKAIAEQLVAHCKSNGIDAYIWCVAKTGSAYVRFGDPRMCSVRIGDHDGREKYKYKYNLRSDIQKPFKEKDGTVWRCYYPIGQISALIEELKERKAMIADWKEVKYQYGTPAHLVNKSV